MATACKYARFQASSRSPNGWGAPGTIQMWIISAVRGKRIEPTGQVPSGRSRPDEHVELQRRQLDGATTARDLVRGDVHDEVRAMEELAAARLAPAKKRPHSRQELVVREGLDEVVVRTRVQAVDAVGDRIAGGEHQDRHVRSFAQAPADLDAVEAGQHAIEDDEIRRPIARGDERAGTIGRDLHGVALVRQRPSERRSETSVVVHHEDPPAHRGST